MGNLDFSANADQLKELAAYMASQINVPTIGIGGGYAPIGSINFFDATVAPQDWLACDGSVYNIADYPQLADWYEAQHGSKNFYGGDGTTTFAVPDLQGEFLRGTGTNSHANQGSGANVGVHQDGTGTGNIYAPGNGNLLFKHSSEITNADSIYDSSNSYIVVTGTVRSDGITSSYTSRPTNTSFLICVKAVVAGEVYSTEERVVGTWIDGKKIYQKTIVLPSRILVSSSWDTIFANIQDLHIDQLIRSEFYDTNSDSSAKYVLVVEGVASLINNNNILIYCPYSNLYKIKAGTIQYTKTTD